MTIKAIETVYNGYRFRSRLEARWAVFFDALGIKYEYEPEGFDLGEVGWYLPDFHLTEQKVWLEIKPTGTASELEDDRYNAFDNALGDAADYEDSPPIYKEHFYVLVGTPYLRDYRVLGPKPVYDKSSGFYKARGLRDLSDLGYTWTECPLCHRFEIAPYDEYLMDGEGLTCQWCDIWDRLKCPDTSSAYFHKGHVISRISGVITDSPRLHRAYLAARSARFEHGENG